MLLDFLLVADMANVDAAGKFNIIGEFNLIRAATLPSPPLRMTLVTRIISQASEGATHRVGIVVVDQDGRQLFKAPDLEATFGPPVPGTTGDFRAQLVIGINGAQFPRYGAYSFHVLVDARFVGERTIYVVAPAAPPGATPDALPPAEPA